MADVLCTKQDLAHPNHLSAVPLVCLPPVRQLIKSQRVQNKLGIVFEKEKDKSQRKDFIFASAKVCTYMQWFGITLCPLKDEVNNTNNDDKSTLHTKNH